MEFMRVKFGFWAWSWGSTLVFTFNVIVKKLECSLLVVLYGFLKQRWYGFVSGFPPFGLFLIVASMGKRSIYLYINKCNKRKNNATFKDKQADNVDKAKPPPTSSCSYRNLKYKKTIGRSKILWRRKLWIARSTSLRFLPQLRSIISRQAYCFQRTSPRSVHNFIGLPCMCTHMYTGTPDSLRR